MKTPKLNSDGSCPDCAVSWRMCRYHQIESQRRFVALSEAIRSASVAQRNAEIDRTMGRFEFESDEFTTAEQKAINYLNR